MSTTQKIQRGVAFILSIGVLVITTEYAGFSIVSKAAEKTQLIKDGSLMWILNICLGALGGLVLAPKRFLAAIPSGIVSACAISGALLLYLSFRESFYQAELIIPLIIGILPGMFLYPFLHKLIYKTQPERNSGENENA